MNSLELFIFVVAVLFLSVGVAGGLTLRVKTKGADPLKALSILAAMIPGVAGFIATGIIILEKKGGGNLTIVLACISAVIVVVMCVLAIYLNKENKKRNKKQAPKQ
ncbi:MAG: hypothetical protein LBD17_00470 [Endomicrobium sp.]|jgi:ABC-type spermidine/putrescine transport system permease subunit II|nr:hypothetical protein [Endomicrobium sp.]